MQLIAKLSVLLLISFAACSTVEDNADAQCVDEHTKQIACYEQEPSGNDIIRDLNATAQTYTGSENDVNTFRSVVKRYCDSGLKYIQCLGNLQLTADCQEPVSQNEKFAVQLRNFVFEYFCRNDGEAMFKIAANNGLKSIISDETGEEIDRCFASVNKTSESGSFPIMFCRYAGSISDCFLEYTDKFSNQNISAIVRDLIPQLKVMANCEVEPASV